MIIFNIVKFIKHIIFIILLTGCFNEGESIPTYLEDYNELYLENPREANLTWFKDSKFGMFIHYGLYSQLEKGEWIQLRDTIEVSEYAQLKDSFNPVNFNADEITELALDAGMKYITITAKHHDGFALFSTSESDFNSINSPAKRDLIKELYDSCKEKGLGLFLYYSYAADWKHPYFYSREEGWKSARPAYKNKQPEYKYKSRDDFRKYIDFAHNQILELLNQYPEIAGIWLDPIMGFYSNPEIFPIEETYQLIRSNNKHVLISFKQGANGDEDFSAPEHNFSARVGSQFEISRKVYELNKDKPKEVCTTLQVAPKHWGYDKRSKHVGVDKVFEIYSKTIANNSNLLLNVGPLPDGSIHEEDINTLISLGKKIKK